MAIAKFGMFTPGAWKSGDVERFGPQMPIFGWTRVDLHDSAYLAGQAGGVCYYRPLPFQNEPDYLRFAHIVDLPFEDQRDIWLDACIKDGRDLQWVIDQVRGAGKPFLVVQLFNEPDEVLADPEWLVRYDDFCFEMSKVLADMGAVAAVWGGGTGWLHPDFLPAMTGMLEATNRETGWCYFEYHAYNPIHPHVWVGANQSHGLTGDESEEEKWAYITRRDWSEPITTKEDLYPAWLGPRLWGHDNGDGTFGMPELWECDLLIGEGVVDSIPDDRLPKEGGGTWFENRFIYQNRLGVAEHEAGVTGLRSADDILNRLPGAPALRIAFCAGPGYGDWLPYDFWRDAKHKDAYEAYLAEVVPEPPLIDLDGETEPPPNGGNGDPPSGDLTAQVIAARESITNARAFLAMASDELQTADDTLAAVQEDVAGAEALYATLKTLAEEAEALASEAAEKADAAGDLIEPD